MTRCQYCNKLTHSEDLVVEYALEDHEKVSELCCLENWDPYYMYAPIKSDEREYGRLKCGDIYIHFKMKV